MKKFERSFYQTACDRRKGIEQLQKMPWFRLLKEDVERGEVFPALRYGGEIHFYYQGSRIYAFQGNTSGELLLDSMDQNAYRKRKEESDSWAKKTSGDSRERAELSTLYRKFTPYVQPAPSMVLLDVEVGFPCLYIENKKIYNNTQVDLLFLDKDTGMLYFIEAKDAGNPEIKRRFTGQSEPELYNSLKIAKQLEKYDANLAAREDQILTAYQDYFDIMREIFGCEIYSGKLSLYKRTKLLVYGKCNSTNSRKSLEAIHTKLGDDLIVYENGLDAVDDLPEKITAG
ncbi:hypothetical protein [Caproiciproducens sp. CPB-2]|uniref:hypothetical protein n=1 Tax=unclassified Caproiciproducens TaxID=2643836 RepID=UPI0023DBE83C|nr:hypothetical protein [Caproiciproducens sp. CPB-2]MDF1494847.1 hypothetical protein [Caproiciproducens sp. CPB-2]